MKANEIKQIAHMARIGLSDKELPKYQDLNNILELVAQIEAIDTSQVEPMQHPIDLHQRLRPDEVTEIARDESTLYLVPNVFEDEGLINAS